MRASRFAILGLGTLLIAWFLLGARQAHDVSAATNIVSQSGPVTPSEAATASNLLNSASTLNPDEEVNVLRAALAADRNQNSRAQRMLERVVREEPGNIEAWYLLAQVAGSVPRLEASALEHIAQLDPKTRPSSG
jgi:hypothetical protein